MEVDSNIVWKKRCTEYQMKNYYMGQYKEEYESIKFIKNIIKDLKFNSLIDLGCGSGSLIYYLKKIIKSEFIGVDICSDTLELAKKYNPDCKFILKDAFNLDIKKDVVLSNQTLIIISPSRQDKFIEKHFELSNKYVVFFSLFTDSKLDINIKINDPYNDEVVYYNVVPIDKIIEIGNRYNYNIEYCENFEIKKELKKPIGKGRGTYTIETSKNKFLQFSDVIYMPWKLIILKKS